MNLGFPPEMVSTVKRKHYLELTIDQKINIKANSAGFPKIYLNQSLTSFKTHFFLRGDEVYTHLTINWFWHNKVNKNRPWDAVPKGELFRKQKTLL